MSVKKRLIRMTESWVTFGRGYHEGVTVDVAIEAVGAEGHFIAPCVSELYLENTLRMFDLELAKS